MACSFDAPVGCTCISKSSGPVLIFGNGFICLSTPSFCCSVSLVRHATVQVPSAIPVPLLLNMVYPVDALVPLVGILVYLFHVFLIVRFSESDLNVV